MALSSHTVHLPGDGQILSIRGYLPGHGPVHLPGHGHVGSIRGYLPGHGPPPSPSITVHSPGDGQISSMRGYLPGEAENRGHGAFFHRCCRVSLLCDVAVNN